MCVGGWSQTFVGCFVCDLQQEVVWLMEQVLPGLRLRYKRETQMEALLNAKAKTTVTGEERKTEGVISLFTPY